MLCMPYINNTNLSGKDRMLNLNLEDQEAGGPHCS